MSDLLSPLLFVMKNEVDAFWCFVGFMDRVASNFEFDQVKFCVRRKLSLCREQIESL